VATCRGQHAEKVIALGAERVIDYEQFDFTDDKESYDYVFDMVGKSTFGQCKRLLKPGGVYISSELGPWSQNVFYSLWAPFRRYLLGKTAKHVKFPFPANKQDSVDMVADLLNRGVFSPLIDREYLIEEIKDAYSYVDSGQKVGNVVIFMSDEI
jgi:NADPH:quinone reductase-like Zn-dependent oxidoreductase